MNPSINPKRYYSILERPSNNKKVLWIPPLFHDNKLITDLKKKGAFQHFFFRKKCSVIDNASKLPVDLVYFTNNKLLDIEFNSWDIAKRIFGSNRSSWSW